MKKLNKRILISISLVIGIILFVSVFIRNLEVFDLLKRISYFYLIFYVLFSFSIILVHVLRWKVIAYSHDIKISYWRLLLYKISGYSISYLTPSAHLGGEAVRGWLVKSKKVKFPLALSSVIIDKYIEITTYFIIGTIGVLILLLNMTITENAFIIISLALILSALSLYLFYTRIAQGKPVISLLLKSIKSKKLKKFKSNIKHTEKLMSKFFANKTKSLMIAFSMSFTSNFLMFLEYFFLLKAFGITATFSQIFMIVAVIAITYILPVPAALGLLETGQFGLFAFMALNPLIGLGLSLIVRLRDCILSAFGLGYLVKRCFKFLGGLE